MFGYNQPTLEKYIGVPFGFGLLAYAIVRLFPSPEAVFFFAAIEINVAIIPAVFLIRQFTDYERGESEPAQEVQPVKAYLDMNKADERGNVYAQVVPVVKFNKVRRFASTLLNMRSVSESSVDLREDTWRVHFGGRDGYIKTRVRFEKVGAFVRKDARPNSPYIVKRWDVVQDVANGNERALQ